MAQQSVPSAAVTGNNIPASHVNNLAHDVDEIYPILPASNAQPWRRDEYPTPGSTTWTCPAGVYTAYVTMCGGGGGGAGGNGGPSHQGGGGGAYRLNFPLAVVPGTVYTVVTGAGGAGGATSGSTGAAGGASSLSASGLPGLYCDGGAGGALSSTDEADQHVLGAVIENFDWPEVGAMSRRAQGRRGHTANAQGLSSDLAPGGAPGANLGNTTTPGLGGGGGTGYGNGSGPGTGGSASLGSGGDGPTTTATTTGFAGGNGIVIIEWQE